MSDHLCSAIKKYAGAQGKIAAAMDIFNTGVIDYLALRALPFREAIIWSANSYVTVSMKVNS